MKKRAWIGYASAFLCLALLIGALIAFFMGHSTLALFLCLPGILLVWRSGGMFGDTKKLPKGAPIPDAKRVKRYRQENPGATIVDAINAINRQDGVN